MCQEGVFIFVHNVTLAKLDLANAEGQSSVLQLNVERGRKQRKQALTPQNRIQLKKKKTLSKEQFVTEELSVI